MDLLTQTINNNRKIKCEERKTSIRSISKDKIIKFCAILLHECVEPSLTLEKSFRKTDFPVRKNTREGIKRLCQMNGRIFSKYSEISSNLIGKLMEFSLWINLFEHGIQMI